VTAGDAVGRAEFFEQERPRLQRVAWRLLGSSAEAEDAVQDAWFRYERADQATIASLPAWLTTVVSRICLDRLRTRTSLRETPLDPAAPLEAPSPTPQAAAELTDATERALVTVLQTLSPDERLALVLHDMAGMTFEEIAALLGRTSASTRQLATRARRRAREAAPPTASEHQRQREVVTAFLQASRAGDLTGLIDLLAPGVVLRADIGAVRMGADPIVQGAETVARTFSGRAAAARLALIDGVPGAAWFAGHEVRVAFVFSLDADGTIGAIDLVADPATLTQKDVDPLVKRGLLKTGSLAGALMKEDNLSHR
jgi:RNA polymerase sigma factor (sigma-70 family)